MEIIDGTLQFGPLISITIGIVVLFVGKRLTDMIPFLREISIPEPVTGGLLFAVLFSLVYLVSGISIEFEMTVRDVLLIYFFTTIGINAQLKDLKSGGKPLLILLMITVAFLFLQNLTGVGVASLFGLPAQVGVIGGSVSLVGGHGTAIAWAPRIASQFGINNAMEIGIACATFGLILASLAGGPVAKFLIRRNKLEPNKLETQDVGPTRQQPTEKIGYFEFLDTILAIHICIIFGALLYEGIKLTGLHLPLFVTSLFAGIVLTNIIPERFPRLTGARWPSRSPAMALVAEVSLGTFLAMSLMSMQLVTLVGLAGPILAILAAQLLLVVVISVFVVFFAMGRSYDAAVISAGFIGFALGSTPTALANMTAVTQRYGASNLAFIVVPLLGAFFIDLINGLLIPFFLTRV